MAVPSRTDGEAEVRARGFSKVLTWTDAPNAYYTPHAHDGLTTLLILSGSMTIKFGEDVDPEKKTYGAGSRIDVVAGRQHEVWIGDKGCTSVIGE